MKMLSAAGFLVLIAAACSVERADTPTTQPSVTSTVPTISLADVDSVETSIGDRAILIGFAIRNNEMYELCGVRLDSDPPQCGSNPVLLLGLESGVTNGSYIRVHGTWEDEGIRVDFKETALGDR